MMNYYLVPVVGVVVVEEEGGVVGVHLNWIQLLPVVLLVEVEMVLLEVVFLVVLFFWVLEDE